MSAYPNVSQIPNFGHAWSLTVTDPDGSTATVGAQAWTPETMEIVFEVDILGYSQKGSRWSANIELYNLSATQVQKFLYGQGSTVVLSAGYQAGPYGVIFAGIVYQAMYERPGVVDSKVTLVCYTGLTGTVGNQIQLRGGAGMTQAELVAKMAAGANTPMVLAPGTIENLQSMPTGQSQYPRARPVFGDPAKMIDDIAEANNLQSWYGSDGVSVSNMSDPNTTSTITYTSTTGILGVPQQTYDGGFMTGVDLIVTLDPRLRVSQPPMQINIASSLVRQLQYTLGGYRPLLDPNGYYFVNGLHFRGDSRGNQWETAINGITTANGLLDYVENPGETDTPLNRRAPVGGQ
jgi:hypothetical protein